MPLQCTGARGCSLPVPSELQAQALCTLHFLRRVEDACGELRREAVFGLSSERAEQASARIAEFGEQLIRLSLNGERLNDELKMSILNGVLALMNLRESVERGAATAREAFQRKALGR